MASGCNPVQMCIGKSEAFMTKLSFCFLMFVDGRGRSKKPNDMLKWITTPCFWVIFWLIECVRTKCTPTKNGSTSKISIIQKKSFSKSMDFVRISTPCRVCLFFFFCGGLATFGGTHGWGRDCGFCTLPPSDGKNSSFSMEPDFRHLNTDPKQ